MELFIRTEANRTTAMGHMMRCLSIADAAVRSGISVTFIVAEEGSAEVPDEKGFETIVLGTAFDNLESELPLMKEIIEERAVSVLLVDSYFVTEKYLSELSVLTHVAYIDDLYEAVWPVQTVINYSVNASELPYEKDYPGVQKLIGCDYMPLRPDYSLVTGVYGGTPVLHTIKSSVKEILVTSGGSDEHHFLLNFIKQAGTHSFLRGAHITVIAGRFNEDLRLMKEEAAALQKSLWVTVYDSIPTLRDAFLKSDIAISAGGTTLYEIAATGTPAICYVMADNQKPNAEGFYKGGYLEYAGDLREAGFYQSLFEKLESLMGNAYKRQDMSQKLRKLVDGRGAERIVDALFERSIPQDNCM
ncbi:MAG: hypothetical protein K6A72_02065 [Lachnospiraceae bacterium]|nr:hypothetical protein [Lachnospiraceae bacterium]